VRTEDGSIIYRCLNGEPGVFGLLVDKYKAGIYAYAYTRLLNFQDAQDVTQEVFLQAYRDLRSLRRWESFVFWLYRIAHNCCAKSANARSRRPDIEFIEDQNPGAIADSSLSSYREDQVDESLQEAIYSLPETYRQVLMLHYFGGMKSSEIAKSLGTSPTAIRMRLSRARAQLKEEMVAMVGTAFEGQKLQASFTFRIVEAVKRIKVNPMPRAAGLPWGLSLAAGIIIAVLSLSPHVSILSDMAIPTGSALPAETEVLKAGEIPVDILKTPEISIIVSKQGNSDSGEPQFQSSQNALMLPPRAEGGTWVKKADMLVARSGLSTSVVNGKIYALGGQGTMRVGRVAEEYDPAQDKWVGKADMPTARFWFSTGVVDGKIYAVGGRETNGAPDTTIVEEYDPVLDKWTRKADMPTSRWWLSVSAVNGKIYAIGGLRLVGDRFSHFSIVEEYDPATDKWTRKAAMPAKIHTLSTSVVNGKIYVIGGVDAGRILSTVYEYNPAADKWTRKANMPTARWVLSTSAVDGKIYAIGGTASDFETGLSVVERYDPDTDTWTKEPDMPTPRSEHSAATINRRIYVIGGRLAKENWSATSTVEEYTPGTTGQSIKTVGKLPTMWGEMKSN